MFGLTPAPPKDDVIFWLTPKCIACKYLDRVTWIVSNEGMLIRFKLSYQFAYYATFIIYFYIPKKAGMCETDKFELLCAEN